MHERKSQISGRIELGSNREKSGQVSVQRAIIGDPNASDKDGNLIYWTPLIPIDGNQIRQRYLR